MQTQYDKKVKILKYHGYYYNPEIWHWVKEWRYGNGCCFKMFIGNQVLDNDVCEFDLYRRIKENDRVAKQHIKNTF